MFGKGVWFLYSQSADPNGAGDFDLNTRGAGLKRASEGSRVWPTATQ